MTRLTHDTFFDGRISVKQPPHGYRFSIDAVILGNLAPLKAGDRVIDLGTGCGVILLILFHRFPDADHLFGVDIQPDLADIARQNAADNDLSERITILHADIKSLSANDTGGAVDVVVCNPPHYPKKSGRINPDNQRAVARHEIKMTLSDLTAAAYRLLKPSGRFMIIYPAERMVDLLHSMRQARLEPKRLRWIHPEPGAEAKRALIHGVKHGRPGLKAHPPLFIRDGSGRYTPEIEAMFRP